MNADRCANPRCRTSIDLDWDADVCPCGDVATCRACDPVDVCEECRIDRDGPTVDLHAAFRAARAQVAAIPDAPDTKAARHITTAPSWRPAPDLTRGDIVIGPADRGRICGRCERGIRAGEQCVTHLAVAGSVAADYYHTHCCELGATA